MARVTIEDVARLDYERVARGITDFLRGMVEEAGAEGYVVGVSGGVDSAVTLFLAERAVGAGRVTALILPDPEATPPGDVEDARLLVKRAGVETHIINIKPIVEVYRSSIPVFQGGEADKAPLGNLKARIRMSLLYYYANRLNKLVAGGGDRSELLIGYFTKYGDGGVDVLPIGVLYKTQVRRLALHLGVPEGVAYKPSSPRLWPGQVAEEEIGLRYEEIDLVLYSLFDLGLEPREVPDATGLPAGTVERVTALYKRSEHKRAPPPTPPLSIVREARL